MITLTYVRLINTLAYFHVIDTLTYFHRMYTLPYFHWIASVQLLPSDPDCSPTGLLKTCMGLDREQAVYMSMQDFGRFELQDVLAVTLIVSRTLSHGAWFGSLMVV